ncbi:protein kinase domain-containing protein [Asanoa siamensis]|uniref:Protein kinase domain-containing protein n=1 Tax=Asanoa siamensis TaxID=926357 RepID=A0ABQ4CSC6_9ACTN|nr:protein kinase [Asanoa siamensis]GIF73913.1 hypothetical protein Asi02nite_34310 [Asanoa siamensis]
MAVDQPGFGPAPTRREGPPIPRPTRREGAGDHGDPGDDEGLLRLPRSLRDRLTIVRDLRGGGEADIVLTRDADGRAHVVKIYRRHIRIDQAAADRLTSLDRSYLVAPVQTGFENGRHWEVMEYVPGGSLADHLGAPGRPAPSTSEIESVVRQVAAGLHELHAAHITHSDLKPANILLRGTDPLRLALSDFGLSKFLGDASKRFTQQALTLAYAAPESFSGRFSPAQDWWALGMIVRRLATGEEPFAGLADQVIMHELSVRPIALDGVTDQRLMLLCRGLLVRDPDHRWDGRQVAAWLAGDSPHVHDVADVRASDALHVADAVCWTRSEAARAFVANWDLARQTYLEHMGTDDRPSAGWRTLRTWLEQFHQDVDRRIRLIDRVLTAQVPPEVRMVHLLLWLDPTLPPVYRGASLLPADLAGLAAVAARGPGDAATIVDELWRYELLPVLAQFAGGAELAEAYRAWRNSRRQLDEVRSMPALPDDGRQALDANAARHQAVLLRAAADPGVPAELASQAGAALDGLPRRPSWLDGLRRLQDPAVALAVLTLVPAAQADNARAAEARNRFLRQWEQEEAHRIEGRNKAIGYAAAAAGIWGGVMLVGAFGGVALFDLAGSTSTPTAGADGGNGGALFLWGFVWLLCTLAEVGLAYQIGAHYHPAWSALNRLTWLGRRLPDVWALVRRAGNSIRAFAAAAPLVVGVLCCVGLCFAPAAAGIGVMAWGVATLAASGGHLVWALVRTQRFGKLRDQREEQLLALHKREVQP